MDSMTKPISKTYVNPRKLKIKGLTQHRADYGNQDHPVKVCGMFSSNFFGIKHAVVLRFFMNL